MMLKKEKEGGYCSLRVLYNIQLSQNNIIYSPNCEYVLRNELIQRSRL